MNTNPSSEQDVNPNAPTRGLFVPLLLLASGFLGWTAIQTMLLLGERQALTATVSQQTTPIAAAHKIRVAADSLASKMQGLADKGNPNAQEVVAELKQRGIAINPKASTLAPPVLSH